MKLEDGSVKGPLKVKSQTCGRTTGVGKDGGDRAAEILETIIFRTVVTRNVISPSAAEDNDGVQISVTCDFGCGSLCVAACPPKYGLSGSRTLLEHRICARSVDDHEPMRMPVYGFES